MKVAILHDYLNQFGGAERVLKIILEMFPEADIYTLLHDEKKTLGFFKENVKGTSFLDLPFVRRRHRFFIPLMPLASNFLRRKENYDLVISSSSGYGKALGIKGSLHVSYCHTPLRYAWDAEYLRRLPLGPLPFSRPIFFPLAKLLRGWDKRSSENVDFFIANSNFIKDKIKECYKREAEIIYPPVDIDLFRPEPHSPQEDYYLMAGRLLYYKRFDLGIKVFNILRKPLKVVGNGPEKKKLKKLAHSPKIEFISGVSDDELRRLYHNARGFIFPQIEDFGLVAAEAQACGVPIIAYKSGGARDIVKDNETGVFFNEQSERSLIDAIGRFEKQEFDRNRISQSAKRFSKESFKNKLKEFIDESLERRSVSENN